MRISGEAGSRGTRGRLSSCKLGRRRVVHADFANVVLDWKAKCPASEGDWVFANSNTGQAYDASTIQQDDIRAAGWKAGLPSDIGWHTFRHTYRSLLDYSAAPVGVQRKLMRHARVSSTISTYGNAQMQSKRTADTTVVQMVLPPRAGLSVAVQSENPTLR